MAPLISYFRDARAELGITAKQIAEATGKEKYGFPLVWCQSVAVAE